MPDERIATFDVSESYRRQLKQDRSRHGERIPGPKSSRRWTWIGLGSAVAIAFVRFLMTRLKDRSQESFENEKAA